MRDVLPHDFYDRDVHDVCRDLLGQIVVRETAAGTCSGRIVEVEAYGGAEDPACHADRGYPTERTRSMFGPPGHAYVYRIYGMYDCLNVVCRRGPTDKAAAILIRALEPVDGVDLMALRRGLEGVTPSRLRRSLLSGPGKLCQALAVDRTLDGHDLAVEPLWIAPGPSIAAGDVQTTPRVGLNPKTCGDSTYFDWRYVVAGSRYLSR